MKEDASGGRRPGAPRLASRINAAEPHSARVWNYLLGGKDNYPADRAAGDQIIQRFPSIPSIASQQRYVLARMVRYLVGEAGVRQFLDIGTGLPTADNTHEVAQQAAPDSRVVYVDNDPLVLVHAEALLTSTPPGVTDYVDADVRDPDKILREAARTLDFTRPIALTMLGIMGQLSDEDDPHRIVRHMMDALPPGSYLALSDGTDVNEALNEAIAAYNANSASSYHLRPPGEIARFFDGLELVDPGVVSVPLWRPDPDPFAEITETEAMCGIARK